MRVISGKLKGRVIKGFDIDGTRPTMDRVKESIFASIQDYMNDAVVLDLFAGSGNLGIEAISNGARGAYFVDINPICIKVIKENIRNFNIDNESFVIKSDYKSALKEFGSKEIKFDIIFIDPPYKYCIKKYLLCLIKEYDILSDRGIVVYEYQGDEKSLEYEGFRLLKDKKYGDKYVSVYKRVVE